MTAKLIFALGAACALVSFATGCGKKDAATEGTAETADGASTEEAPAAPTEGAEAPPPAPPTGGLPGESGVHQALASKDYQGAVGRLAGMQGSVKREQWEQYISLQYQVRNALTEASDTDPKAAEALLTLNAMNRGR